MNWLARRAANRAHGERFRGLFWITIVAFCRALMIRTTQKIASHLFDHLHLAVKASGTTLDQGHIGCQAHPVDMTPGLEIVQGVKDYIKFSEPGHRELDVLDVGMMCFELHIGIETCRRFLGDLESALADESSPTKALDFLICSWRKRNWRLRLLRSMVSRSTMQT